MIPKLPTFSLLLYLISFGACSDQNIVSEHKVEIPENGWDTNFELSIVNVSPDGAKKVSAKVVHNSDYGYENLYLSTILVQERDTIYNDLVNISLMDNLGTWIGAQQGRNFAASKAISSINPSKGPISLYLKQYSREELLQNIESISLVLSR